MEEVLPRDKMQNDTIVYRPDGLTRRFTLYAGLIKNAIFRDLSGAEKTIQAYNNVLLDSGANGAVIWDNDSETVIFVAPKDWLYGEIINGSAWVSEVTSNDVETVLSQLHDYIRDNPITRWDDFLAELYSSVQRMMPQTQALTATIADLDDSSITIDYLPDFSSSNKLIELALKNFTPGMLAKAATAIATAASQTGQEMTLGYRISIAIQSFGLSFNACIRF